MNRRRLVYIGIATALLAGGALLDLRSRRPSAPSELPAASGSTSSAEAPPPPPPLSGRLRSPPSALAELGVLTDRPESALSEWVDREAVARLVQAGQCGEKEACDAVRAALRDEQTTRLQIAARSDWDVDRIDLDAATAGLAPVARKGLAGRTRIVSIHVATATSTFEGRHLAVRAAFAAAAAIAAKIDGLVYDPVLGRIESAADFAAHAVTEQNGGSSFRRDRVQLLYQPRGEGIVRILTAGLSRWGAPDVEAAAVPTAASQRVAEIVLGVAEAIAKGVASGPVTLSRADIEHARGAPYPQSAGLPADHAVAIDLAAAHPESGDPNDFIARIVPPAGEGPMGYLELSEAFFGPGLAASPGEDAVRARAAQAQRSLAQALTRWALARASGAKLRVQLPFVIPGDAGVESMWVDVTDYSDRSITGKLLDEPLAATDVARGDSITRPRADVEDIQERSAERE